MNCSEVTDLLFAFCSGEVAGEEKEAIARHLEECPACREEYEKTKRLLALIRSSAPFPERSIAEGVLAKIASEKQKPKFDRSKFIRFGSLAASVFFVFAGIFLFVRFGGQKKMISEDMAAEEAPMEYLLSNGGLSAAAGNETDEPEEDRMGAALYLYKSEFAETGQSDGILPEEEAAAELTSQYANAETAPQSTAAPAGLRSPNPADGEKHSDNADSTSANSIFSPEKWLGENLPDTIGKNLILFRFDGEGDELEILKSVFPDAAQSAFSRDTLLLLSFDSEAERTEAIEKWEKTAEEKKIGCKGKNSLHPTAAGGKYLLAFLVGENGQ